MDAHDLTTLTPEQAERFWSRVDQSAGPDACWPWTGSINAAGYGFAWVGGRRIRAHRVAYALGAGPIPAGDHHGTTCVCHACDNPACCNPAHLWLGSQRDNIADRTAKGRSASGDRNAARLYPERMARGPRRPGVSPRGEKSARAKLTDAIVRSILVERAAGRTFSELAAKYAVSPSAVAKVCNGLSWRHITGLEPCPTCAGRGGRLEASGGWRP